MRVEVECIAVVSQGVDKIMIRTDDALSVPEEKMILNLVRDRGEMEAGERYEMILNKLQKNITAMSP